MIPLVIQDRMFDTNGQLFFPAGQAGGVLWTPNPEHPYWVPEFVGDAIVVNGKAWPYLNVQAKRYRFLFLNGSNARTYELALQSPGHRCGGPDAVGHRQRRRLPGRAGGPRSGRRAEAGDACRASGTRSIVDFAAFAGRT